MTNFHTFKVLVPAFLVFTLCLTVCHCESFPQLQSIQNNNGYSTPSTPPFIQTHHRNHNTRTNGLSYPTESRTVVPLFLPMILFVGIVLLLFFAVVGSAAVAGSASAIGRHVPTRFAFARDFGSSAALARNVLSSEQCVERISCEVFRVAKGYKAQNWILRAFRLLPAKSNLTKRAARTVWGQSKPSRARRLGKGNCLEFQCSTITHFLHAMNMLRME